MKKDGLRDVYVIGIGQTKFTKQPQFSAIELGVQACGAAIKDAGIDPRKFQVAWAGRIEQASTTAQAVLKSFGVHSIECMNVENACATGGAAVRGLWRDIATGLYDVGIAMGVESLSTSPIAGKLVPTAKGNFLDLIGMPAIGNMAMAAQALMQLRGHTMEELAYAAYKNHKAALYNPYAHYRKELSLEEIVNSEVIASPITKLMCCPMSDGAAAVIMCTKEIAYQYTNNPVKMETAELVSGCFSTYDDDPAQRFPNLKLLSKLAYENSGCGPEDLNIIELHDAYSPEELITYENLLLCPPGETSKLIRDGVVEMGGRCPVNLSGGLLSLGHPLGASGARVVCDVVRQLRGQAPAEVQIPVRKCGMAEMVGGSVGRPGPEAGFMAIMTI
ncbi:MAG: thiolase family protein [Oscillospiraceae bacterium]|jgi:benzoylsuccinyl-CoA thiolase BbsB subunit